MSYVGFSGVANQANTTDGFARGVGASNDPDESAYGENVGDGGVVDLYHDGIGRVKYFIADEGSPGYVLQESGYKIELESN